MELWREFRTSEVSENQDPYSVFPTRNPKPSSSSLDRSEFATQQSKFRELGSVWSCGANFERAKSLGTKTPTRFFRLGIQHQNQVLLIGASLQHSKANSGSWVVAGLVPAMSILLSKLKAGNVWKRSSIHAARANPRSSKTPIWFIRLGQQTQQDFWRRARLDVHVATSSTDKVFLSDGISGRAGGDGGFSSSGKRIRGSSIFLGSVVFEKYSRTFVWDPIGILCIFLWLFQLFCLYAVLV